MEDLPSCPPGTNRPPSDDPPERDYFEYLCGQVQNSYADAYYKATAEKDFERATYYRGKLDAYVEIRQHYLELKK